MKKYRLFILFSAVLLIAIFIVEHINSRFWLNDFKVYYSAAEALRNGSQVYGQSFGLSTGFYKYSPFTLLCFVPSTFFSFEIASGIHFFVLCICTILSIVLLQNILNQNKLFKTEKKVNLILILAFVCIVNHLVRELHLGNVNMLIVLLLSACIYFDLKSNYLWAGLAFAMALFIKPYLLILGMPLLLYKKNKTILSTVIASLAAVLLVTIFLGLNLSYQLHLDWLKAMMDHGSYLQSSHTIISILNHLGVYFIQQSQQLYLITTLLIIYLIVFLIWIKPKENKENNNFIVITTYFIFLAFIPNLLITDTEHFLFTLPVILILMNDLFVFKNKIQIAFFVLLILAYGANSSDLLGSRLSDNFEKWALLGIGNLGLIVLLIYMESNRKKLNKHSSNIELS